MDKSQQELIRQIMDVKDEKLRDDLLRKIANSDTGGDSAVLSELAKLGLNTAGVKEYASFQAKSNLVAGYLVGGGFAVGGAVATFWQITRPYNVDGMFGPWFPALFCAAGIYALFNTYKLSKAFKK